MLSAAVKIDITFCVEQIFNNSETLSTTECIRLRLR